MNRHKACIRNIPGWIIVVAAFGILYFTGLHTEAIGQLQRLVLATGLVKADIPENIGVKHALDSEEAAAAATSVPGHMAGSGLQLVNLQGKLVSMESLKGKVIFMNIWATWCPPCIAEMPHIQSLYDKVKSDKIAFVMLSVDEGGMDKVKKFIGKKGFSFPVYMLSSQLPKAFEASAIPTTFIISPDGRIVARQEGMAAYDTPEMRKFLQSMVK